MIKEDKSNSIKITFFGFGAVGSVMACCLYELLKNKNKEINFVFIVRNMKKAKQYLFRAPHIIKNSNFLQIKDFDVIFRNYKNYKILYKTDIFINASSPDFNDKILRLAINFKSCYCDLASVMGHYATKSLKFEQQRFHEKFMEDEIFGLINVGISPGITNFLVGEKIIELKHLNNITKIDSVNLYLLEHMDSNQVLFSWAPKISLDELEDNPRYIRNKKLIKIKPFTNYKTYRFPHFQRDVTQYPIFQEEVLSLHDSFPEVKYLHIFTGGSDVELIKNLFQLNLLSKKNIECVKNNMSIEQIVRSILPGMKSPKKIEEMNKNGEIKYAQFAAIAEILYYIKNKNSQVKVPVTETLGLSFHRYSELLGTPYSGATYISYPTGVGAAILLFHTFQSWQKNKQKFSGIIKAEEIPEKMEINDISEIKQKLSLYKIDIISHTHSLSKSN